MVREHPAQELGDVAFTTIFQDDEGWIWLGAKSGIYRFDGQIFMPIQLPDSLNNVPVTALFETEEKLCAGFKNGAITYLDDYNGKMPLPSGDLDEDRRKAPKMERWNPEEGAPQAAITGFCHDGLGGIWIATYGEGLYVWKNNRLYQFNQADDGITNDDIYTIVSDGKGRVWAATDAGISICSMPEQGKKFVQTLTKTNGLPDEIISALAIDNEGNIWGGTNESGVFRFNTLQGKVDIVSGEWQYGAVTSLSVFGDAEIWVGTDKSGLVRFDATTGSQIAMPADQAPGRVKIHTLAKDREGLLWLIADRGGLYSANVKFGYLDTPFSGLQAILTDSSGHLWVGCQHGLYLRNGHQFTQVLPVSENVVSLWECPSSGDIWAGTLGRGLFILKKSGKIKSRIEEGAALPNGSILSIGGNRNYAWLATLGGVSQINTQTMEVDKRFAADELGSYYVYKVFSDSRGGIWFGTDGKGLVRFDQGVFKAYTEAAGIPLRTIYSITEDREGSIWFSTARDGLFRFDGANFKRYTTQNHLHSMNITGVTADGTGKIVVAYEDGFDILNPYRFDHVNYCSPNIGAPPTEINLNAVWTDARGNVWLGGQRGLVHISAYHEPLLEDPQPGLTGVSTILKPVDFVHNNSFSYDQNYLLFNFLGLWYTNPDAVRYRFRLEGFDPDWKISKDHSASYPKLGPGHYTFRIQTSEHGNFENVPEASWQFTIQAPFWERWWFILFLTSVLAGLIFTFIRTREKRLQREAILHREKVLSQFETLKSQINPHFLFNSFNTLITIIEENPKVAVEYVEHLSDFYRSIMVYRERDLIKLGEEMELVHSFEYLLKKRYEDSFHLIDRVNGQSGQLMPLSLQMLVENAVKHNIISASRPLTVEIYPENGHIVVRNNLQRKIKPETSTHFGLQSLVKRYKLLGERSVLIEENKDWFTVKIPLL